MLRVIALVFIFLAATAGATEPCSDEQLFAFVSDASVFEGQFYSVHDYCSPYAGEPASTLALKSWQATNDQLLKDRDQLVESIIRSKDLNSEQAATLRSVVRGFVEKARHDHRLYKDLINEPDKLMSCSGRLGAMNSSSMSFKGLAPASFQVWQRYRGL
jgi:hypothetical protein